MCTLTPIVKTECPTGRAGIARLWVIPSAAVTGLTFAADGRIQAISIDCSYTGGWVSIGFDNATAFLSQSKQGSGANVSVTQTVRFTETVMTQEYSDAIMNLSRCCSLHAVVLDNTGAYHYIGVSTYVGGEWQTERLRSREGYGNTGADPAQDINEFSEALEVITNTYAPRLTGSPIAISTNCDGITIFGTTSNGSTAFGTSLDGDTVFGTSIHP